MHYSCFELYCASTERRQSHQIARNHPERHKKKEFVCPLCKALGNAFLPIIWRGKEEAYPGVLEAETCFEDWIDAIMGLSLSKFQSYTTGEEDSFDDTRYREKFALYASKAIIPPLASRLPSQAPPGPFSGPRSALTSLIPSLLPSVGGSSAASPWPNSPNSLLEELASIYGRLKATMQSNQLPTQFSESTSRLSDVTDLIFSDTLPRTLAFSIAATEIAQRGVQSGPNQILLEKVPSLTLTHLRILSETASSYIAIAGTKPSGHNQSAEEFYQMSHRQLWQLFAGHPQNLGDPALWMANRLPPALSQDPFVLLTESSIYLVPALDLDIFHVLRLCYLLELVKVVFSFLIDPEAFNKLSRFSYLGTATDKEGCDAVAEGAKIMSTDGLNALRGFCARIHDLAYPDRRGNPLVERMLSDINGNVYAAIVPYALTFLRKAIILLYVRFGVNFPESGFADKAKPEIERLTKALRLPSLPEMFASVGASISAGPTVTQSIVYGWIAHWQWIYRKGDINQASIDLRPSHPAIFELIGLPRNFDTLTFEAMRRRCPTTGKELVDPAICLFCGDIFCSQAICCHKDGKGGCSQHMEK